MKTPKPIKRITDFLAALPGIGPRQAVRLAFYLIHRGQGFQSELAELLRDLQGVKICSRCFYIYEGSGNLCEICADSKRDRGVIAIVEKETDLTSIENTGKFGGRYLVLGDFGRGGVLEADQKLKLRSFVKWLEKELGGKAKEIIVAFNPDTQGDFMATQVAGELKDKAEKITRLGIGIPAGGEIEFADEDTLGSALKGRS